MQAANPSRRQFVQLAGGLALALRHGLLPAQAFAAGPAPRAAATLEDGTLRLEWDSHLHTRVVRSAGRHRST